MLAFRSLDPFRALREPDRRRRDEERLSRSEQRTLSKTQNNHLTGKAPYKFESGLLQRRVQCEPDTDDFLAAGGAVLAEPLADRAQHEMPAQRPVSAGCNTAFSAPRGTFSIGLCRTQQEHD